jgi:hypothetical protein
VLRIAGLMDPFDFSSLACSRYGTDELHLQSFFGYSGMQSRILRLHGHKAVSSFGLQGLSAFPSLSSDGGICEPTLSDQLDCEFEDCLNNGWNRGLG